MKKFLQNVLSPAPSMIISDHESGEGRRGSKINQIRSQYHYLITLLIDELNQKR